MIFTTNKDNKKIKLLMQKSEVKFYFGNLVQWWEKKVRFFQIHFKIFFSIYFVKIEETVLC